MVRAPFFALTMASAIALAAVAPVRAQAVADPGRSPDAAFVAKASDAAAVDAELGDACRDAGARGRCEGFAQAGPRSTDAALARESLR